MSTTDTTVNEPVAIARTLPVISLRGNVAFPQLSFRIETLSPSGFLAFSEAVEDTNELFLLTQRDLIQEEPDPDGFYSIGTIAKIKKVIQNPDMSRTLILEGVSRGKVLQITDGHGFYKAEVTEIVAPPSPETSAVHDDVMLLREELHELEKYEREVAHNAYLAAVSVEDYGKLSDFVASLILTDYRRKQRILFEIDPAARLHVLVEILREEIEQSLFYAEVESTVRENIDENHREYYLREQLKAIQAELGVEEDDEVKEYADRILTSHLPKEVSDKLNKELARLEKTPFGAAESTVLRNYLDICLDIPWGVEANEPVLLSEAEQVLQQGHDGLNKVKERILEYIAVRQIAPDVKGQIFCLVGPPGVGKTSIAISIAHALKRSYARISLGGIRDEADIRGHRKTYVGAMPGRIVEALINAKSMNPVIILDEIDKLASSQMGDPSSALLEVLDPEQNREFRDHYTEIPMDLSDCIFIATANYYNGIPAPLLDRMEVIELSSYTEREKYSIAIHHLIPKQLKKHGLSDKQLHFTESGVYALIRSYTKEAGVRDLERQIAAVCRKVAKKIAEGTAKSLTFTLSNAASYLGMKKYLEDDVIAVNPIGVVNGLAYTSVGGELLKVEVAVMEGTGKVELTGSLGDVMKESAHIAVSYVRSIADRLTINADFYKKNDLHIHFPEGAVPKDGPSAGITMTCAIISALASLPARSNIAMTGEVTLHGNVLPIGGLKEKTMAAYRAHIDTVLIPRKNLPDLETIDAEVRKRLTFIPCDTVEDALKHIIVTDEKQLFRNTPAVSRRTTQKNTLPTGKTIQNTGMQA